MAQLKITPKIEDFIIQKIAIGIPYKRIVERVKDEFGVSLTVMSISNVKKKIKEVMTSNFVTALDEEQKIDLDIKRSSLNRCIGMALELSENVLINLKAKQEQEELSRGEVRTLNDIIDRLVRMRTILEAQKTLTKEIEFPTTKEIRQKYKFSKVEK